MVSKFSDKTSIGQLLTFIRHGEIPVKPMLSILLFVVKHRDC